MLLLKPVFNGPNLYYHYYYCFPGYDVGVVEWGFRSGLRGLSLSYIGFSRVDGSGKCELPSLFSFKLAVGEQWGVGMISITLCA